MSMPVTVRFLVRATRERYGSNRRFVAAGVEVSRSATEARSLRKYLRCTAAKPLDLVIVYLYDPAIVQCSN
jgi:hypothetical protein